MARRSRRERITAAFDRLYDAVAGALGGVAALDRAAKSHAETMVEMWLRDAGLDGARADAELVGVIANPRLADVVARVQADRDAAFGSWLRTGPAALIDLMGTAAPGAAGAVENWLGASTQGPDTRAEGIRYDGAVPELWRIGTGRVGGDDPAFPVGVPLVDESHLQIMTTPDTRSAAEALVETLLMRLVSFFPPGLVQLHVWDTGQLAGAAPNLYPLTRTGLLTVHDPRRLPQLLEDLSDRIRAVHTRVLVDGHPSLAAMPGSRTEPWVVAVLAGNGRALREEDHRQLQRVARAGPACGVHLVMIDVPVTLNAPVETVRLQDGGSSSTMTGPNITLAIDPPPTTAALSEACTKISAWHETHRSKVQPLTDLLPVDTWWAQSAKRELRAPIGFIDGAPHDVVLADLSPHALIGGPSGSGKTNLILTMIASLAARYEPDELALYLLDFKEGVSFAQFAPGPERFAVPAPCPARRRQHQHGPRVRAGAAAVPRRRDAPSRRGGEGARSEQAGGVAGEGPHEGPVAPDRRRHRRVPVPLRREGRDHADGHGPPGGRGAAGTFPRHPPRARQPGRVGDRRVLGAPGHLRAVRAAHRTAPGPRRARQGERRGAVAAPLARGGQPRLRHPLRQPDRADPGRLDQGPGR